MWVIIINDFQIVNIEFIEFWMLLFFFDLDNFQQLVFDFDQKEGNLYINFGNVLEDILKDFCWFFENGFFGLVNENCLINMI